MSGVHTAVGALTYGTKTISRTQPYGGAHEVHTTIQLGGGVARPRFLYVTGTVRDGSPMPPWPDRHAPLRGEPSGDGTWVSWRLAGANNRELGRSARVHPDLGACRQDALDVTDQAPKASALISMSHESGLWTWRLDSEGRPIAVSGRGHQRRRECEYSLSRFLSAIPDAVIPEVGRHHDRGRSRPEAGFRLVGGPGAA